jgi:hypothetical protein
MWKTIATSIQSFTSWRVWDFDLNNSIHHSIILTLIHTWIVFCRTKIKIKISTPHHRRTSTTITSLYKFLMHLSSLSSTTFSPLCAHTFHIRWISEAFNASHARWKDEWGSICHETMKNAKKKLKKYLPDFHLKFCQQNDSSSLKAFISIHPFETTYTHTHKKCKIQKRNKKIIELFSESNMKNTHT